MLMVNIFLFPSCSCGHHSGYMFIWDKTHFPDIDICKLLLRLIDILIAVWFTLYLASDKGET
jgi:hypothetical protein